MLEIGQKVLVLTDKGVAHEASIIARAPGVDGAAAYKVAITSLGAEQPGQWHRANELFIPEETWQEKKDSWDKFMKE